MNQLKLLTDFNDFLRRVELAKFDITDDDKRTLKEVMQFITPPQLTKANNAREIMVKTLSKNPEEPVFKHYIMVDTKSVVATDGYRLAMLPNIDGMEPGIYNELFQKVPHSGIEIELDRYRNMVDQERKNKITVTQDQCKIIRKGDGSDAVEFVEVADLLKFNLGHFMEFTNGAPDFEIYYNDPSIASACEIINPDFPELTLVIVNIVV